MEKALATELLEKKIEIILNEFLGRVPEEPSIRKITCRANRNSWLEAVYEAGLVEASTWTRDLTDKLIMAKVLQRLLGDQFARFHPRTLGLKEFLCENGLLDKDGSLAATESQLALAFDSVFPKGFVVKPTTDFNSLGKESVIYFKKDAVLKDLLSAKLYRAGEVFEATASEFLWGAIASGERFMVQENAQSAVGLESVVEAKIFPEVRTHTFGNRCVPGTVYVRWREQNFKFDSQNLQRAYAFTEELLGLLPRAFVDRQAWSLDIAVFPNGKLQIIEVNSNRGKPLQWSGFMSRPNVLRAYTRFFETEMKMRFEGISGWLLRLGLANWGKFLYKKFVEKSQ